MVFIWTVGATRTDTESRAAMCKQMTSYRHIRNYFVQLDFVDLSPLIIA